MNEKLGLFISISFGVFIFILFFQPFPVDRFDFNNRLLFYGGFGGIVFLFLFLIRVTLPWIFNSNQVSDDEYLIPKSFLGFIILVLNSVAFAFYLRYVGGVGISFFIMFKVILICLSPPVILGLHDAFKNLKKQNESAVIEKKLLHARIEKYEEDMLNKSVEFLSESNTENFSLLVAEVAFVKSADNYVEIVYKEGNIFKKRLLRNTLKNIELQLKPYSIFLRCHRICIVNTHFIEKLNKNFNTYWITIAGSDEQIPVSRQYLLKLKETI